jgi:homoserine kinase type II
MQRLQGKSVVQPGEQHCRAIGTTLARMHLAGAGFPLRLENSRGGQWRQALGEQLLPMVNESDARILQQELYEQAARPYNGLPRGVIHADLFRDNALFVDHQVSGVVDFYNACDDDLVYDVAITVNDWCVDPKGSLDFERAAALCQAYQASRPLCDAERRAWPMMLRRAALRFWLSRLWDWHHPKSGELTFQKDPDAFKDILLARRQECDAVLDLWAC